jgi:hypothetical protein
MLTLSFCSPPASPPEPEREEVGMYPLASAIGTDPSAFAIGADPSASATGAVTIAMAGTAPPAGVTPPPATGTVVETPRAMTVKKAVMKKSSL